LTKNFRQTKILWGAPPPPKKIAPCNDAADDQWLYMKM